MKVFILLALLYPLHNAIAAECDHTITRPLPHLTLYTEHWPPYQKVENDDLVTGVIADKIKEVLTAVNWPFQIKAVPWPRAIYLAENIKNSLIFSVARFPEREENYQWIASLSTITSKLIRFNNDKNITINTLNDVKKYNLVLKRGEASSVYFSKNDMVTQNKTIWVSSSKQALKLLSIGRGDLYPVATTSFSEAIAESDFHKNQFSYVYDFTELDVDLYLATSLKTSQTLVKEISSLFSCYSDKKYTTSNVRKH